MKRSFSISKAVSYGFSVMKKNFIFFVGILLIVLIVNLLPGIFSMDGSGGFIAFIIGWSAALIVDIGLINVALKIYDRKKAYYLDLFRKYRLFINYFLGSVIYGLLVAFGLILLIIPGIYWGIKYQYYAYFIVDRDMGPIGALKESGKITKDVKWKLFFFKITLALVNFAGLLLLGIGLLATIPTTFMAEAYVFRKLSSK